MMTNRLKEWRVKRGYSQAKLAKLVDTTPPQIHRLEHSERTLSMDWARRIAPALNITPAELLFKQIEIVCSQKNKTASLLTQSVYVLGEAQAGAFKTAVLWGEDMQYAVEVPISDEYKTAKSYGLKIVGASMNLLYPEHSIVICIPIHELNRDIRETERVHVEVTRGGEVEATIKEYRLGDNGEQWLWPRSSDPLWQTPIKIDHAALDDSCEVIIRGIVIGSYRPE
jgi:transcriptional regulator with XRE-family HTH domain